MGGDHVIVRSRELVWSGSELALSTVGPETARWRQDGHAFLAEPQAGGSVALHWDRVGDLLTPGRLAFLRRQTDCQLAIVNHRVAHPGPAAVLA